MKKYGFIYLWFDRKRKMYYIGSHWGTKDDGYICSSNRMRDAYRRRPQDFNRRIITNNIPRDILLDEEHKWLSLIKDEELGTKYYNLRKHKWGHWSTDELSKMTVGQKISKSHNRPETKKRLSESKLGNNNPMKRQEVVAKRLETWKKGNHNAWNKGIKTGPNPQHSERMKGSSPPNKGKKLSIAQRNNLSYCKSWIVIDPEGNEIMVYNLNNWCKTRGLEATNLRSVAYGRRLSHKGYKCRGPYGNSI